MITCVDKRCNRLVRQWISKLQISPRKAIILQIQYVTGVCGHWMQIGSCHPEEIGQDLFKLRKGYARSIIPCRCFSSISHSRNRSDIDIVICEALIDYQDGLGIQCLSGGRGHVELPGHHCCVYRSDIFDDIDCFDSYRSTLATASNGSR
jgi:hypothetical protein